MSQLTGLTRAELVEKTNAPIWLIDRLRSDRKLPLIKKPKKRGSPALYHPKSVEILKAHLI